MRDTKGIKRAATGMVFSAVIALSLLATTGQANAASLDTRDGVTVAQETFTLPLLPPFIKGVLGTLGISWED